MKNCERTPPIFWISFGVLVFFSAIWPGDIPWINDEPQIILNALRANEAGQLARKGLLGTVGFHYSPLPTWYYQFFLIFTSDLVLISFAKNLAMLGILCVSLLSIARILGYPRYPLLLIFISPYLYFYNRIIWDNCFLTTLSVILVALFLLFVFHPRIRLFYISLLVVVILYHIHPMAFFIIIPFFVTIIAVEPQWIFRHRFKVISGITLATAACLPHLLTIIETIKFTQPAAGAPGIMNMITGMNGIKFFIFSDFITYFLPEIFSTSFIYPQIMTFILVGITYSAIPLFLSGVIYAILSIKRKFSEKEAFAVEDKLVIFLLGCILINILFYVVLNHKHHPHYLNSVWFAYFFFLWQAFSRHSKSLLGRCIFFTYVSALGAMQVGTIAFVHYNGGNRGIHYGATLQNQIDIVDQRLQFSPASEVAIYVKNMIYFPQAYQTIYTILSRNPDKSENNNRPTKKLIINYNERKKPKSGWIKLEEENYTPKNLPK